MFFDNARLTDLEKSFNHSKNKKKQKAEKVKDI